MGFVRVSEFVKLFKGLQRWGERFLMVFLKASRTITPRSIFHVAKAVSARIRIFSQLDFSVGSTRV